MLAITGPAAQAAAAVAAVVFSVGSRPAAVVHLGLAPTLADLLGRWILVEPEPITTLGPVTSTALRPTPRVGGPAWHAQSAVEPTELPATTLLLRQAQIAKNQPTEPA